MLDTKHPPPLGGGKDGGVAGGDGGGVPGDGVVGGGGVGGVTVPQPEQLQPPLQLLSP